MKLGLYHVVSAHCAHDNTRRNLAPTFLYQAAPLKIASRVSFESIYPWQSQDLSDWYSTKTHKPNGIEMKLVRGVRTFSSAK